MTRFISLSLLCLSAGVAHGFAPIIFRATPNVALSPLFASVDETSTSTGGVPLVVEGKNLEVTDALFDYVDKRVGNTLDKLSGDNVRECDVILSVSKNPKVKNNHRVEVVTNLKGTTIICTFESPDMYSSIDSAAAALNRKLIKYKERRLAGWHGGAAMGDDLKSALEALEEDFAESAEEAAYDDFVDPEAPTVTKTNSFQLDKPISLEEAIFALDYVDHDFYVFTNEESGKVTTVYKRHGGGIGLIEP
uniref:Sigma 54 modulation/S30EA ribosomal protein C-terminal domain-containing protein n=1 Tax=Entomoneis paludosa TaxID=265537 RepID=A0A7S3DPX1_9STRA|mmetsp:Transcript_27066/g.56688  ORF Transcript_27066/g.56688 Transcript_27066/m.56688 type:complete len:249 (+) Transcript_27066:76-822(+)|eukprot:CAMPEP_0172445456 /NCGR_PEP_ID=MMETSP1065-20121228/5290_1 /TAXON_ID=265537 /ORGANISM="Amphiprora paludosa, Strain CCMP125" /LENGTH=248 /DNA_ID=CAMNT_0013196315 /DNA_START=1 /DNA_END=747 /DNA_ORIENTATION=-